MPDKPSRPAPLTRSWRTRRFGVTVEVPRRIGKRLKVLQPFASHEVAPRLHVADRVPDLHVERHDVDAALMSWRSAENTDFQEQVRKETVVQTDLAKRVAGVWWYHSIELPGGVVTPGEYDHRPLVPYYGIPDDLTGQRVLDVASFDGFWSFEFERRGGDVTAVDVATWAELDHAYPVQDRWDEIGERPPTGAGFRIAAEALGSKVRRVTSNVYDLDPAELGTFDLVHMGDLLLHLRDPVRALRRVRSVTGGRAMIVDSINTEVSPPPGQHLVDYRGGWHATIWWLPTLDTLAQMVLDAGFSDVHVHLVYRLDLKFTSGAWRAVLMATP